MLAGAQPGGTSLMTLRMMHAVKGRRCLRLRAAHARRCVRHNRTTTEAVTSYALLPESLVSHSLSADYCVLSCGAASVAGFTLEVLKILV
jgi:hypothetical protein